LTETFIWENILTLILVFFTVCFSRSFYKASNVPSKVDPKEVDLKVKKANSINESIPVGDDPNEDENFTCAEDSIEHCKKCEKFRFKRSHHCTICYSCTDKFDHHCFILNNCIGRKNYNYFVSYLFMVTCLSGYILIMSSAVLYNYKQDMKEVN
jgi:hypothetical protein